MLEVFDLENLQTAALILIVVLVIFYLKKYFSGAVYIIPQLDLSDKYAIVTGGSSGIGEQTVRTLAKLGCSIIIADRNKEQAEKIIKSIRQTSPKAKVEFSYIQLSDEESIETFVKSVGFPKIDYLVNNAGIFALPKRKLTKDGIEMHMAVNYLGHVYLTYLLWDKLKASTFFRVVNLASSAHKKIMSMGSQPKLDFNNLHFDKDYSPNLAYSRSKMYVVMFTQSLATRIDSKKGLIVSVHPGAVRTHILDIVYTQAWYGTFLKYYNYATYFSYFFFTKSPKQGSYTSLYSLLSEDVENGFYYADCAKDSINSQINESTRAQLWEITEKLLKIKLQF